VPVATLAPVNNGGSRVFRLLTALSVCVGVIAVPSIGALQSSASAAQTVTITEYRAGLPTDANAYAHPNAIVAGPDGNLWFTGANGIGRINPATGAIQIFSTGAAPYDSPTFLTVGPDKNLWFTFIFAHAVGRITPAGVVTIFTAGISGDTVAITSGADGNLWFTESTYGGSIGRITPAGVVTEFPAPLATNAVSIVAGPDGNVWYLGYGTRSISRVTPAGVVTTFPTPTEDGVRLTVGPDGALWATTFQNHVERITMQGAVTIFPTGTGVQSALVGIVTGPDGALWITETLNKIARVTTTGDVTQYQHGISAGAGPQEITVGPDGNLWFTESGQTGGRPGIAKMVVKGLPDVPVPTALTRLSGADRFGTANAIADSEYPRVESAQGVVLARADDFPDALAGSTLAVKLNAPLLLTQSGTLGYTVTEVERVLTWGKTVTVLGGTDAISDQRVLDLEGAGYHVQRISGADRYATAAAIADAVDAPTAILLADGSGFADALSAGAAAGYIGGVVLLTDGAAMPSQTASYVAAHPGVPVFAVGGPAANAAPTATPLVGADRYATSVAVAKQFFTAPTKAGLANGQTFPDALAGDVENGRLGAPMLLVGSTTLPATVRAYLSGTASIKSLNVYGGTTAVADSVANAAAAGAGISR
jgi:streptogramin lyase/putative cell wall-binding protein